MATPLRTPRFVDLAALKEVDGKIPSFTWSSIVDAARNPQGPMGPPVTLAALREVDKAYSLSPHKAEEERVLASLADLGGLVTLLKKLPMPSKPRWRGKRQMDGKELISILDDRRAMPVNGTIGDGHSARSVDTFGTSDTLVTEFSFRTDSRPEQSHGFSMVVTTPSQLASFFDPMDQTNAHVYPFQLSRPPPPAYIQCTSSDLSSQPTTQNPNNTPPSHIQGTAIPDRGMLQIPACPRRALKKIRPQPLSCIESNESLYHSQKKPTVPQAAGDESVLTGSCEDEDEVEDDEREDEESSKRQENSKKAAIQPPQQSTNFSHPTRRTTNPHSPLPPLPASSQRPKITSKDPFLDPHCSNTVNMRGGAGPSRLISSTNSKIRLRGGFMRTPYFSRRRNPSRKPVITIETATLETDGTAHEREMAGSTTQIEVHNKKCKGEQCSEHGQWPLLKNLVSAVYYHDKERSVMGRIGDVALFLVFARTPWQKVDVEA